MAGRKNRDVLQDIRNTVAADARTYEPHTHNNEILEDILEALEDGGGGVVAGALVATDNGANGIKLSIRNEVE
jgi:predicted hydrolase (HD superfamily)